MADLLGAGVAKALLGKAAVPDDLPFVTGSIGLLGTKPSYDLMMNCDTLLMIGSRFPYSEFLPKEGHARGVQIDLDPKMLSIRYPMEVNLVGDSAESLGFLGLEMGKPDDIAPMWERALSADRPVLVEAHVDPNVPPLPPHITFEQAKGYVSALFGGDVDAWGILKSSVKEMASSYLPDTMERV